MRRCPARVRRPSLSATYDCVSCGRCCYGQRNYVQVFAADAARLGAARTAELVAPAIGELPASEGRKSEPLRYLKMTHGRCAALDTHIAGRFSCAVYDDRPILCRAFAPGSSACLEARARLPAL